ncbi:MAG: heme o synthase [Elusimicrobiota bacterium]
MKTINPWLNRLSLVLVCFTGLLIFAGGMVKSTGSSLSVPDWPLSYGQVMPPMIGGIFYEHGHRMIATLVGFITIILAVFFQMKEERKWLKKMAWAALALVILQGVLGGLTVLFLLPKPISMGHAILAQTFFCLVVCLFIWTSSFWNKEPIIRTESAQYVPLHRLTLILFFASFIQLFLGALTRHTGENLPFHIFGAVLVASLTFWVTKRIFQFHPERKKLFRLSLGLSLLLLVQISLGICTYFIINHTFETIPGPLWSYILVSTHVVIGAFFLSGTVIQALVAYKTRPLQSPPLQTILKDYVTLTKPGISFMAGITALGGYILGSRDHFDWIKLIHTSLGTLLVAAGAGALNMLIEMKSDAQMKRTQERPLPSGRLRPWEVLIFGGLCSLVGIIYLAGSINYLTAFLAALTLSIYLYIYTPLKKISAVCVTVGAVSGALPPMMGWAAATNTIGIEAWNLFGIIFFWQFPHFLSLAWLYKEDYGGAGYHMLPDFFPNEKSTSGTALLNTILLLAASCLPYFLKMAGLIYLGTAIFLTLPLLIYSYQFFQTNSNIYAKKLFLFSLLYVPVLMLVLVLNRWPQLKVGF